MAYSTANWHWKNKTVTRWAKDWFERELVTIQVQGEDGAVISVERVVEVDGDVEIGRRKSKYVLTFLLKFATSLAVQSDSEDPLLANFTPIRMKRLTAWADL